MATCLLVTRIFLFLAVSICQHRDLRTRLRNTTMTYRMRQPQFLREGIRTVINVVPENFNHPTQILMIPIVTCASTARHYVFFGSSNSSGTSQSSFQI